MSAEREIPAARASELTASGAQLVDVREPYEYDAGRIPGARLIELSQLSDGAASLDQARPVVFYCRSGERSLMAAEAFAASGWEAYTVAGGLLAWADAGLPLEPDGATVAERHL